MRRLEPGVGREDVDLVRVYLQHIGKRKLLKAARRGGHWRAHRKGAARSGQRRSATFRSAIQTLVALADRIRSKGDPAAELILLPEGGELQEEHIAPVLRRSTGSRRRRCIIDELRAKLENPRLGARDQGAARGTNRRARGTPSPRTSPRSRFARRSSTTSSPSCSRSTRNSGRSSTLPRDRARRRAARRWRRSVGLPRAEFRRRFTRVQQPRTSSAKPSAS